jgi:hypothetical protein
VQFYCVMINLTTLNMITLLPLKVLMPWVLGFFTYSSIQEHLTSIVGLEGNKSYNHQSLQLKNNGFWVWRELVTANPSKISLSQLWTMSTFYMARALLTETMFDAENKIGLDISISKLNFVNFVSYFVKFVSLSNFVKFCQICWMLNLKKSNNHSNLTINVIEFFFFFGLWNYNSNYIQQVLIVYTIFLFLVLVKCSLILKLMLLLNFMNMSNLKIYFIE